MDVEGLVDINRGLVMRAAKIRLYTELIHRLSAQIKPTEEPSMTDTDTAPAAPAPVDQSQIETPQDATAIPPTTDMATDVASEPMAATDSTQSPIQETTTDAPSSPMPKCTATATATDAPPAPAAPQNTPTQTPTGTPPTTPGEDSPFIKTAIAAANLIEQLRQHPESQVFLQALLKCLEPPKPTSSND